MDRAKIRLLKQEIYRGMEGGREREREGGEKGGREKVTDTERGRERA